MSSANDSRDAAGLAEKINIAVKSAAPALTEDEWQPWKFRIADRCVELFAEDAAFARVLDPDGRETMLRCGAALQSLKLALKRQGCLGRIELFPALDQPALVARVHGGTLGAADEQERMLFSAITPVGFPPVGNLPVPDATLSLISRAVAGERAWLEVAQSESSRGRLLETARAGERWQTQENGIRCEVGPAGSNSGFESTGFNNNTLMERIKGRRKLGARLRVSVSAVQVADEVNDAPESGVFGVVKTKTDDKHGWVAAGQAVALLILTARTLGVCCTFFNRALRKTAVREELRTCIGHKGFAQAIARLDAAEHPISLPTAIGRVDSAPRNSL
jgi:hypothetical protein